ncbi:MAG TPA: AraC family transcriptional regulator [Lachnospiraceae bacterium]|nr:AraC family transcriptional regulator [Lachnospiraceae bacterium]
MNLNGEWNREEFIRREENISHQALETEFAFYLAVKAGNLKVVEDNCNHGEFVKAAHSVSLSRQSIQNLRYHFIITTAMITRFCTEGGMELEQAYRLSDFFIRKMDKMDRFEDIVKLHRTMVMDYTEKMQTLRKKAVPSRPVRQCIDYIYKNLHQRITVKMLAKQVGMTPSYLSKQFRGEMQISIGDYINRAKIEAAQNMLLYSEYSLTEIANYLDYSSQSYFIQIFRQVVGITPGKYRKQHFRDGWMKQ